MRKAAFVSLTLGFGFAALVVLPVACGSSASHPGSLVTDNEGGIVIPPPSGDGSSSVDTGADTTLPPTDAGPTTVSITLGDGGSATDIAFGDNGLVNCGAAATSVPVTITNTGKSTLTWTATLSAGATHYQLSPASGAISPGGSSPMNIIPAAIPTPSDVTTDLYGGVVTIQSSASNEPTHVIQLHQTARGVILKSTLGAALNFGSAAVTQTAKSPFSLTNVGNLPATVNLSVGSNDFGILPPAGAGTIPFVIAANGTAAPTITFSPSAVQTYADTMVTSILQDAGAVAMCGPLPGPVSLAGSGNNTVVVNPTNVDFGTTNCGDTAQPSKVTLTNNGASITYAIALAKGANSPFNVSPTSGTLPSGSQDFTITPKNVPKPSSTTANGFGDTLTITTTIAGISTPHNVTLTQTARGAILQFNPLALSSLGPAGKTQFGGFSVVNVGNYQGTFLLGDGTPNGTVTQTTGSGTWSSNLGSGNLVGGSSAPGVLSIVNPGSGQQNLGHITLTVQPNASGPTILCADSPPDFELSATGQ